MFDTDHVQDAIVTDVYLGMSTTVGSHVFAAMKAKSNATIIDKVPWSILLASPLGLRDLLTPNGCPQLLDAGLIILGKANMTVCISDLCYIYMELHYSRVESMPISTALL
jgi:hypothetical protein